MCKLKVFISGFLQNSTVAEIDFGREYIATCSPSEGFEFGWDVETPDCLPDQMM